MLIELKEDGSKLVSIINEVDGSKVEKLVSMSDFISSIIASNEINEIDNVKTVVSHFYGSYKNMKLLQTISYSEKDIVYILHWKKAKAPMITEINNLVCHGEIGFPSLLFAIRVVNDRVFSMRLCATKDEEINPKTQIYKYPFTNVSSHAWGEVCLGGNDFTNYVINYNTIFDIPNMFFSMPNTTHGFNTVYNSKGYCLEELIIKLKDRDFDENLLVPRNKIYAEWIEKI